MDEATFHRVKALLPAADPAYESILAERASRLYVAVLKHRLDAIPQNPKVEDLMWLKAHGVQTALNRITTAYKTSLGLDDDTPLVLKLNGETVSEDTAVGELPVRDRLLIMTAHLNQQPASQQSANSGTLSPRPPLQPVTNRQLTVPPAQSQDDHSKTTASSMSASPAAATPPPAPASAATSAVKTEGRPFDPAFHTIPVQPRLVSHANGHQAGSSTASPTVKQQQGPTNDQPTASTDSTETGPSATPPKAAEEEPETQYEPRDQGNPFAASQDDVEFTRGRNLQQLGTETTPERLEAGVVAGLQVLSSIVEPLNKLGDHPDAVNWLEQIEKVRADAAKSRTVVGVVGNTGAGKSSVINAMLEEERLVPTNCMRACTAVVTEMAYNESTNLNMKYRAQIEFIQPEDWEKELHILFKEIFDESGNISKDVGTPDSEAGVAYAKVRAVYHKHTREMLVNTSVNSLMKQKHVKNVLGAVRRFHDKNPRSFYERLQKYVDSKEKGTEKLDKNGNKIGDRKREFEFWPLIKVVKIYTKADALSTGAVIVDLPGVHDSNAARAAVAEGYMKECTGLWIVAPINRAVDDKAAKTLLGDTFKRQLKYDGTYSAVTFLCSKTDDISRMEASDSLDLGDEYARLEDQLIDIERRGKSLKAELRELRDKKKDYEEAIDQLEEDVEKWDDLADKHEKGETVYPPREKKRKRRNSSGGSSKRRRRATVDSDDESVDRSSSPESQDEASEEAAEPLTGDAIQEKLDELKQTKKDARREKNNASSRIEELKQSLAENEDEQNAADAQQTAICIAGRNEYSRGAIRQDFAAGIRELDQEAAQDEDPDNFNPEEDIRDSDEVARSLPVFCVSSRAYQKLSGRLKKDNMVPGYTSVHETEIPQLQAHCKKLTEKGRQASCRRFLNNLQSLLTSMALWASDDGSGAKMSSSQRSAEKAFLAKKLKELEKALENTVSNCLEDAVDSLNEQLIEKFAGAIRAAVDTAGTTSTKWGMKKDQGGLYYSTYKATARRQGVFTSPTAGHRDFNGELTEPLYKNLASAWEKTFQRRLPHILQSCTKSGTAVVKAFHTAIEARVRKKGHGVGRIGMIGQQLQSHTAKFADLVATAIETMNNGQKDINREFTPVIAAAMEDAYNYCTEERGSGCFKRMKDYMESHVSTQRSTMFRTASESVRNSLLTLIGEVKKSMLDKADEVYVAMSRDYLTIVGVQKSEIRMSREERAIRREVDEALGGADAYFDKILVASLEDLKAEYQLQEDATVTEPIDDAEEDAMDVDDEDDEDIDQSDKEGVDQSHDDAASKADTDEAASATRGDEDFD